MTLPPAMVSEMAGLEGSKRPIPIAAERSRIVSVDETAVFQRETREGLQAIGSPYYEDDLVVWDEER
jgi:hypothetical protein